MQALPLGGYISTSAGGDSRIYALLQKRDGDRYRELDHAGGAVSWVSIHPVQ